MKSTETLPPDHSPVGTRITLCAESCAAVMSTISAVRDSTLIPTTAPTNDAPEPLKVNVAPCALNPAIVGHAAATDYATRKVALPEMRAPTEPPIEAEAKVAFPLNDNGPAIARAPEVPAARTVLEM